MPRTRPHGDGSLTTVWSAFAGRVLLAVLVAVALFGPAIGRAVPAAAQASTVTFSTAEAAPADSVFYLVTTLNDESEQWRLADVLLDRAGFGEALDKAMAEEMVDESGQPIPLDAILGGEVGVIVGQTALETLAAESMAGGDLEAMLGGMDMATPAAADPLAAQGFAAVLDARAPDTAWAAIEGEIAKGTVEESTYEGTTIYYSPPDAGEDEGMATARVGDLILFGITPSDLHPIIDTAEGRSEAITTLPEFETARAALPQEFLMFGFGNSAAAMNVDLGPFATAAGQLNADAFSGLTIAATEPGLRMETVAIPAEGGTLTPGAANFESELVALAPSDALFFMNAADLGATGVLDAIGASAIALAFGMGGAGATPAPDASMEDFIAEQYETAASLIGINLQTEFFQQLSGEYGAWIAADDAGGNVSGIFASGTADADAVGNALMQLSFLLQGASGAESPLTTRDVDGGQVYVVDLGDGSTFEFGVAGDRLVLGSGDAIDRLEAAGDDSLVDNAQFQAVMDTLPVERNGLLYIDLERAIPLLETVSEASEDFGGSMMGGMTDANESCADYATQEEAQTAYDAAEAGTFDLDQDFDGQVCEDFFVTEEAPANSGDAGMDAADALADVDYSAIKAYALAAYDDDQGLRRSSSILYISE